MNLEPSAHAPGIFAQFDRDGPDYSLPVDERGDIILPPGILARLRENPYFETAMSFY
jgi:hypothetical protein